MNIKDIARLANVGVSTVSRVINNHPDVKESTRERVQQIMKESNYIPNNSARILKQNNTKNIGVLVKGVFNPFFYEMTKVMGNKISEAGYTMIMDQNEYKFYEEVDVLRSFIKDKRLQGVICLGGNFFDIKNGDFNDVDIPIVLTSVNTITKKYKENYSSVGIDDEKAAYEATKYLINKGHEKIALIIGDANDLGVSWWRLKGYEKALKEKGIEVIDELVVIGEYTKKGSYEVISELLKSRNDFTAIFAVSDIMAVGAAKAVIDHGLRIPEDISIMGFDGMDESKYYNPSITTVKQPKKHMAEIGINLLLSLINGEKDNEHIVLDTELIERGSCTDIRKNP